MTISQKRQERRLREANLQRQALDHAIHAATREINALMIELERLDAVKQAVLPGILRTLEDFYEGAKFAAQNQFDGEINRIKARLERQRSDVLAHQAARDALGGDQ